MKEDPKNPGACSSWARAFGITSGCINTNIQLNPCCNKCAHCTGKKYDNLCEKTLSYTATLSGLSELTKALDIYGILPLIVKKIKNRSKIPYMKELENLNCSID